MPREDNAHELRRKLGRARIQIWNLHKTLEGVARSLGLPPLHPDRPQAPWAVRTPNFSNRLIEEAAALRKQRTAYLARLRLLNPLVHAAQEWASMVDRVVAADMEDKVDEDVLAEHRRISDRLYAEVLLVQSILALTDPQSPL